MSNITIDGKLIDTKTPHWTKATYDEFKSNQYKNITFSVSDNHAAIVDVKDGSLT